jgi:hypothetical protein
MSSTVQIIPGPSTSEVTRSRAEAGLKQIASRRQASTYTIDEVDGNWVGALVFETATKVSDGNPFGGGGEEEAPSPDPGAGAPSAGPDDDADSSDGPPPSDGGSDGPPSDGDDKGKKDKKGESGEIKQVLDALHAIADALGVPLATDGMVPGADDGTGGPPGGPGGPPPGPPGLGGPAGPPPPGGPPGAAAPPGHSMKPGMTPPGGTPVGAPAFASVRPDHPWAHVAGKLPHFRAAVQIGEQPMEQVVSSISELAREIGYQAKVRESRDDDGNRIAVALLAAN